MASRYSVALAALLAATAVAAGAYAAHGLADRLEALGYVETQAKRIDWFETAARYQLNHALGALVAVALSTSAIAPKVASKAVLAFFVGTLFFCGSLYIMTFAPPTWSKLGAVTPLGGLAFMLGWLIIAVGAFRQQTPK